jgi:NAD(P)-dependent dehydrogenase (short-subunit alcohol dehydrogenase family)
MLILTYNNYSNSSPGATLTNFTESGDYSKEALAALDKMVCEQMVPLHRWGQPHEVANVITFLASDKVSSYRCFC